MNATFYTFSKKENSTKRPASGSGTQYAIYLKDATGILSPQIEIHYSGAGDPSAFNYAYIGDFGRYYFVREWTYNKGIWTATLAVDALASWKEYIASANLYILRASNSAAWNARAVDNLYPALQPCKMIGETFADPWGTPEIVLGIIGDSSHGNARGAVNYYALTGTQAETFFEFLLVGNNGNNYISALETLFSMAFDDVFRSTFDPMQYVVSAKWYPFSITDYIGQTGVVVGKLPVGVSPQIGSVKMLRPVPVKTIGPLSVSVPVHPQLATRGMYLGAAPWSRYVLDFQPFGRIEIDGSMLIGATSFEATVFVDLITGSAQLQVRALFGDGTSHYIGSYAGSIGADVQLAQITHNFYQNVAEAVPSIAYSAVAGDYIGALSAVIGTATETRYNLSSVGSNGSILPYVLNYPRLELHYYEIPPADDDHRGRPALVESVLSNYPGYLQCAEGDISLPSTQEERETIGQYLTAGFFLE